MKPSQDITYITDHNSIRPPLVHDDDINLLKAHPMRAVAIAKGLRMQVGCNDLETNNRLSSTGKPTVEKKKRSPHLVDRSA